MDFSVKDVARVVGLTPHTLRYYESIGLPSEVEWASRNYRLFNVMDIIDLVRIKRLTGLGFNLRHVRQTMDGPTSPEVTAAPNARRQVLTQQIDEFREKWAKIEEIRSAQTPLDVAIELVDLECAWADAQSRLDVKNRLKLKAKLLAAFTDDPDRLKYERLIRAFIEKHGDPGLQELRELGTRLKVLEPDVSPEEIAVLVGDYARVPGPIRARFASTSEKTLTLASAMKEFACNKAQLTVVTNAQKRLWSSNGESPDPPQAPE